MTNNGQTNRGQTAKTNWHRKRSYLPRAAHFVGHSTIGIWKRFDMIYRFVYITKYQGIKL